MLWSCFDKELIVDRTQRQQHSYEFMMMNNRLNKLTDSRESQLNYFSRQPGKPTKHKKCKGSPLLEQTNHPSLLITSRCIERPPTPHFHSQNSSILWQDDDSSNNEEILILQQPSSFSDSILIIEREDEEKQQNKSQHIEPHQFSPDNQRTNSPSSHSHSPAKDRQSPIVILEQDDENIIWIDSHQFSPHSEKYESQIKIQQNEQQSDYSQNRQSNSQLLSQIPQMSEQDDLDSQSHQHLHTTSNIPISPQTMPLLKLQKIQHKLAQLQQQYWITQERIDNNTISYLSPDKNKEKQSPPLSVPTKKRQNVILDKVAVTKALERKKTAPFQSSILKSEELKQDISPRKLHSISEMKFLIENQSSFVSERLAEQKGTIQILKHLISLKIRLPPSQLQPHTFSQEQQLQINKLIIRRLAALLQQ